MALRGNTLPLVLKFRAKASNRVAVEGLIIAIIAEGDSATIDYSPSKVRYSHPSTGFITSFPSMSWVQDPTVLPAPSTVMISVLTGIFISASTTSRNSSSLLAWNSASNFSNPR